jgi:hypothetical protein
MSSNNSPSIAERNRRPTATTVAWSVLVGAAIVGTIAAVHYARLDLTLSHYDARGHLVVARRLMDSLTPGWRQLGALWLPLPHVLDVLPVLSWWGYQTGYPAVAISILSLALGLAALASYLVRQTDSYAVAIGTPAIILANPNLLYLQSTPMTEPLLLGLGFISLLLVDRWLERPDIRTTWQARAALAALTLTRYEGWCMAAVLVTLAALLQWRRGAKVALALCPAFIVPVMAFLLLSYGATGAFFVSDGFFVPENPAHHRSLLALQQVVSGTDALGGSALVAVGGFGALAAVAALVGRRRECLALAVIAAVALPAYAFYEGHPYRVRYMVTAVAGLALLAAILTRYLPRPVGAAVVAVLLLASLWEHPPFEARAPMVLEAQSETPFRVARAAVTAYLSATYDGTPILASLGSLGHYVQETSHAGLGVRNFLHEGNGDLWTAALVDPARHVHWMLTEERAEGGDVLAQRIRADPTFLRGFTRVAQGGGLVLYRTGCGPDGDCEAIRRDAP